MAEIVDLAKAREAEANRICAIRMKLAAAIAKAVVEAEPIDTGKLLKRGRAYRASGRFARGERGSGDRLGEPDRDH